MPGFLKINYFHAEMCVCVCVYAPEAIHTQLVEQFLLRFMALPIDAINRHDPSNKMHLQLQPKKSKIMLYYLFI